MIQCRHATHFPVWATFLNRHRAEIGKPQVAENVSHTIRHGKRLVPEVQPNDRVAEKAFLLDLSREPVPVNTRVGQKLDQRRSAGGDRKRTIRVRRDPGVTVAKADAVRERPTGFRDEGDRLAPVKLVRSPPAPSSRVAFPSQAGELFPPLPPPRAAGRGGRPRRGRTFSAVHDRAATRRAASASDAALG